MMAKPHDDEFKKQMRELRCPHCHSLLAREYIFKGRLEIKCWGCHEVNRFVYKDLRPDRSAKISTGETQQ